MLIYDEPLLSGQPPLSGHLPKQQQKQNHQDSVLLHFTKLKTPTPLLLPPATSPSAQHRHTAAPPPLTTLIAVPLDNPLISRSWGSELTNKMTA